MSTPHKIIMGIALSMLAPAHAFDYHSPPDMRAKREAQYRQDFYWFRRALDLDLIDYSVPFLTDLSTFKDKDRAEVISDLKRAGWIVDAHDVSACKISAPGDEI